MKILSILLFCLAFSLSAFAQDWRKMSESELKSTVPEKAPVIKENIETEFRTASGVTDGKNEIFSVVIITAGYEADGKYTHYLKTAKNLSLGKVVLKEGEYVFGSKRVDNTTLSVSFYQAKNGKLVGSVKAKVEQKKGAIYSVLIEPSVEKKGKIYIGRFSMEYILQ
ncbi:MAG TPA: hypothetical protein PKY82_29590 [Pyrinomonadaceae bacterium]|nr:hypothetical protein [Pyrinomonadaceae bacterium]